MTKKSIRFCTEALNSSLPLKNAVAIMKKYCEDAWLVKNNDGLLVGALTKDEVSEAVARKVPLTSPLQTLLDEKNDLSANDITMADIATNLFDEVKVLNEIIENNPNSIVVADNKGKVLVANKAFGIFVGMNSSQALGRTVFELEAEKVFWPSVTDLTLQEKKRVSIIQKTSIGTEVIVTGIPLFDNQGNVYRVISSAINVKEVSRLTKYIGESEELINTLSPNPEGPRVVFQSEAMKHIFTMAKNVAKASSTVLITGESGTGKEVLARYIHQHSGRQNNQFVQINCSAIPETLFESELFGYESGAFSGATKGGKKGLIEYAHKGTLFLDEIAEMPLNMQVKLLTSIQNKQIIPVGGTKPIDIDIRIIAATNKDLKKEVEKGTFRLDLYYRLNVIPIHIPALRERKEDIKPLAKFFLEKLSKQCQKKVVISEEVREVLLTYDWPGNIRELENVIENIVVTANEPTVDKEDLPLYLYTTDSTDSIIVKNITTLANAFEEVEKQLVTQAYKRFHSSYKLAKALGISQSSAHRKMQQYLSPKGKLAIGDSPPPLRGGGTDRQA